MKPTWTYQAKCVRVVDGDTIDVVVDLGFRNYREERLRLLGVNCPETKGKTREAGLAAKDYTQEWTDKLANVDWPILIKTEKSDAFGRYLAIVWSVTTERSLNDDLIIDGHAVVDIR